MDITAIVDVETSGLNANTDKLLEIAIMVVDDTLEIIDRFEQVIHYQQFAVNDLYKNSDPYVQDMHDKNGLWDALIQFGPGPGTTDLIVSEWLKATIPAEADDVVWAGNSLRLDLNFIEAQLPKSFDVIGYHSIDMSGTERFLRRFAGMDEYVKQPTRSHRAMADVEQCYMQMLHAANHITSIEPSLYGYYYQPAGLHGAS